MVYFKFKLPLTFIKNKSYYVMVANLPTGLH